MKAEEIDPDEIDWNDQDDEDADVTCWVCNSCSHVESLRPAWGGQCPRCGCIMEEETL